MASFDPSKHYETECKYCLELFQARTCYRDKAIRSGLNPPAFCSRRCYNASKVGSGNPNWKGGLTQNAGGYVLAYAPSHPNANKDGCVMEHRLVMELHIGRFLEAKEVVHHKNRVRNDNRIENLTLLADSAAHMHEHGDFVSLPCDWCGSLIERSAGHRRRKPHAFCSVECSSKFGLKKIKDGKTFKEHRDRL